MHVEQFTDWTNGLYDYFSRLRVIVLVTPFTIAHLTRFLLRKKSVLNNKIIPLFGSAQILFLSLAIMAMFASQGLTYLETLK